ncbi:MAG: hypothetical protein H6867_03935 [Rhodospirillales bacterium]|nr:hypothetical protein [Rhodospirillales bacterium]MCB9996301.1 hypothetical protein [Rhodospirillales bacterium]
MSNSSQSDRHIGDEFGAEANAYNQDPNQPGSDADTTIRMTGRERSDETEEGMEARRRRYLEELERAAREQDEEKERQSGRKSDDKAGFAKPEGEEADAPASEDGQDLYEVEGLSRYGMKDKGDYMTLKGKGRKHPMTGEREITDKQLRMVLMTAVLHKGWQDNIAFYRGGRIDSQLTTRARLMMASDAGFMKACQGRNLPQVQTSLSETPPVWAESGFAKWSHARRYKAQTAEGERGDKKTIKETVNKLADKFRDAEGHSLKEDMTGKRREREPVGGEAPERDAAGATHETPAGGPSAGAGSAAPG